MSILKFIEVTKEQYKDFMLNLDSDKYTYVDMKPLCRIDIRDKENQEVIAYRTFLIGFSNRHNGYFIREDFVEVH